MKTFFLSLISAVAIGSGLQENLEIIQDVMTSEVTTTETIAQSDTNPGQSVSWYTEVIIETVGSVSDNMTEATNSLVMSFETGQAPNVLSEGQYVLSYAQFENPDAPGNYSSFTCQVMYTAVDDITVSPMANVSLKNYYGTGSWVSGATAPTEDQMIADGPWVLLGDGTEQDRDWKNAFGIESDPNTTVNCGASRLIGPIPNSVYGSSSLTFTWNEINGFIDIKSGMDYAFMTGYKISTDETTYTIETDGTAFNVMWEDSVSFASSLNASVAAAALILTASAF